MNSREKDILWMVGGAVLGYYVTKIPSFIIFFAGAPSRQSERNYHLTNAGVGVVASLSSYHYATPCSKGFAVGSAITAAQGAYHAVKT